MKLIYPAIIITLLAASCKEQPVQIDMSKGGDWDSTYTAAPETPQTKLYLLEELTGVQCANCPYGAEVLDDLNEQNGNKFVIVGLHAGALTHTITHPDPATYPKSIQDFTTDDGTQIMKLIFGGDADKPAVSFDRLPIGNGSNKYFVSAYTNWGQAITQMKTNAGSTPVNITVNSAYRSDKDQYDIEVKVSFTQNVTNTLALNIFAIEDNIKDAFIHSDTLITYNHVFRDALTPPTGKIILTDHSTKEAGLVYMYRTALKIDITDPKQKYWKPGDMKIVAFVSNSTADDIHVYQAAETNLE